MKRTHTCGALRAKDAGQQVILAGWVAGRRDHGGVIFIDLRDREGLTQIVFNPSLAAEVATMAHTLRAEFVVKIEGKVSLRPEGSLPVSGSVMPPAYWLKFGRPTDV